MVSDREKATWLLVLSMERAYYLQSFEAGKLGSKAYHVLEHTMADINAEAGGAPVSELGKIYDRIFYDFLIKQMYKMRPTHAFEAGLAYIAAQHEVEHLTHDLDHTEDSVNLKKVRDEHEDNVDRMSETLGVLRAKAPKSIAAFQQRWVLTEILLEQRKAVAHLQHEGELIDLDAAPLLGEIDHEIEIIAKRAKRPNKLTKTIEIGLEKTKDVVNKTTDAVGAGAAGAVGDISAKAAGAVGNVLAGGNRRPSKEPAEGGQITVELADLDEPSTLGACVEVKEASLARAREGERALP